MNLQTKTFRQLARQSQEPQVWAFWTWRLRRISLPPNLILAKNVPDVACRTGFCMTCFATANLLIRGAAAQISVSRNGYQIAVPDRLVGVGFWFGRV